MTQEHTSPDAPYWVDLTREEYIGYSLQIARAFGPLRFRTGQLIISLVCLALLGGLTVYDAYVFGQTDWMMLVLTAALAVIAIGFWAYVPHRLRRYAGREYDGMIECGYSYCGELHISDTEIAKVGQQMTTRVRLDGSAVFIESADMMAFIGQQQRAIVLPARCLTKEIADRLRAAAGRLPVTAHRFFGRIRTEGQTPSAPIAESLNVLWEQTIHYDPQETLDILKTRTVRHFWSRLPYLTLMCTLIGLLFGWSDTSIWSSVLYFLGALALMTVLRLVMPLSRVGRMQRTGQAPVTHKELRVTLTDRGVWILEGDFFACVPWRRVEHVYDRGDYAEMLWDSRFLRIPKRCISDIVTFDAILKQNRKNK